MGINVIEQLGDDIKEHAKSLKPGTEKIDFFGNSVVLYGEQSDQFEEARKGNALAFEAGFEKCRRAVLDILDSPEKMTRLQLKDLIKAIQY